MSPTNLGALPSASPIPNGRVQVKRGVGNVVSDWSSASTVGAIIGDGASGSMSITYTPTYPCMWAVRGRVMTIGKSGPLSRFDIAILLSPADLDGVGASGNPGITIVTFCAVPASFGWRSWSGSCMFRLAAGTAYTASLAFAYSSGGVQQFHHAWPYTAIMGRVVGEGVV